MKKILSTLMLCSVLTACGVVGNTVISDQSLKEKAAFALNTTADRVVISQRNPSMDSISFVATVGGASHQCYITTVMGAISSDALCSGKGSAKSDKASEVKSNNQQCNALLRAAGRC